VDRARAFGEKWGATAYATLDDALADPAVELVACLTSHRAHVPVMTAAIDAGRPAFTEKPMAPTYAEARAMIERAEARGVRIASAPISWLGELQQTARRWVEDGRLGTVRLAYADVNWGRIERWHPAPEAFYDIGPLFDVGVYPLTVLTALFGPVTEVRADAARLLEDRVRLDGSPFALGAPDAVVASLRMARGPMVRLTVNFYVADALRQRGIELHGDEGSVWVSNWMSFDGSLEHAPLGEEYRPVSLLREPEVSLPWAAGLEELAASVIENRPAVLDPAHAAHVVDVMETIIASADAGQSMTLSSTFTRPEALAWAADLALPG
jgi:predicted dehydrogenase